MEVRNRKDFNGLLEEQLRVEVVIPILQQMGMKGIVDNHGNAEFGKDIVCSSESATGAPIVYAVVLKAGNLSGKKTTEAAAQVVQAFNTEFTIGQDSAKRRANIVLVITNGRVTNDNEARLRSLLLPHQHQYVEVWNGDELWNKWTSLFPVTLEDLKKEQQKRIARIGDEAVYVEEWIGEQSRGVILKVRDASKLSDEHIKGSIQFTFPDSEEGRIAREQYVEHIRTGAPLSLSTKFAKVSFPAIMDKIIQHFDHEVLEFSTLKIGPTESDVRFPVKITLSDNSGNGVTLDYIDWRMLQAGTEQVTFVNDTQNIPIRFQMTFDRTNGQADYTYSMSGEAASASWILKMMDLERYLQHDSRMTITMLNTGTELVSAKNQANEDIEFDEEEYEFYKELSAIEQVIKQPILIPSTALSDDDHANLITLRTLLRSPVIYESWSDANLTYISDGSGTTELTELLAGRETTIRYRGESSITFDGEELLLGQFQRDIKSAMLANLNDVIQVLKDSDRPTGITELQLRLVPGESTEMRTIFLDWIDAPPATQYRNKTQPILKPEDGDWIL